MNVETKRAQTRKTKGFFNENEEKKQVSEFYWQEMVLKRKTDKSILKI